MKKRYLNKLLDTFSLLLLLLFLLSSKLHASTHFSDLNVCETVAVAAENAFNLPSGILTSIARVESGRKTDTGVYRAWPWTINDNGKGLFFDTRKSAVDYIVKQKEFDNTRIDIGCMQISVKWHSHAFSSPESMLDPYTNIAYAAVFLEELYQTHGDWELAIKYYHSADTKKNIPYLQKVNAVWKNQPQPIVEPTTASSSIKISESLIKPEKVNISPTSYPNITVNDEKKLTNSKLAMSLVNKKETKLIKSEKIKRSQPPENFIKSQPYLASEWEKVIHFRELFTSQ